MTNPLALPNTPLVYAEPTRTGRVSVAWGGKAWYYYHDIPLSKYPGGEPLVRVKDVPAMTRDGVLILRPPTMEAFFAALFMVDAFKARGGESPALFLPHIPGARQDRLNPEGDYLFTAKSVADAINQRGFRKVMVLDPHSDVSAALIDRAEVLHVTDKYHSLMPNGHHYKAVISPDAGAEKRALAVAKRMGLPLLHAWKSRDISTGAITGFGSQPLVDAEGKSGHFLVVDDLCDAGGTFIGLADVIAVQGGTADLMVTHGLFTKGTETLLTRFKQIFTTDSTLNHKPGITVIPVCDETLNEPNYG